MTAQEYVDKLRILVPSKEYMKEKGLEERRIELFYPNFNITKRYVTTSVWNNEPILDLCYNFDFGKYYEIMGFSLTYPDFYEEDNKINNSHYLFGSFEMDGVAINRKTKEIEVLNHEDDYHTIFDYCALNSSKFLDAMFIMAQFGAEIIFDKSFTLIEDIPAKEKIALQCAEAAGGMKYHHFYQMWLHCY